LELGKDNF